MSNRVKVEYTTVGGFQSTAYVDEETLEGVDKHTDEPVQLEVRYFEDPGGEAVPEPPQTVAEMVDTLNANVRRLAAGVDLKNVVSEMPMEKP